MMKIKRARQAFWPRYITVQAVMSPEDYRALRSGAAVEVDDDLAAVMIARGSVAAAEDAPVTVADEEET